MRLSLHQLKWALLTGGWVVMGCGCVEETDVRAPALSSVTSATRDGSSATSDDSERSNGAENSEGSEDTFEQSMRKLEALKQAELSRQAQARAESNEASVTAQHTEARSPTVPLPLSIADENPSALLSRYRLRRREPEFLQQPEARQRVEALRVCRAFAWVARTSAETPELKDSLATFKDAAALDPLMRAEAAEVLAARARKRFEANDFPASTQYVRWALELEPGAEVARYVEGELAYRENALPEAAHAYGRGLQANPRSFLLASALRKVTREMGTVTGQRKSAHFSVAFEGRYDDELARQTLESLEKAYDEVGRLFGERPSEPTSLTLYTEQGFAQNRHVAWAAAYFDGKIRIPAGGALGQSVDFKTTLHHEYAHALFRRVTGGRNTPGWLNEGMAELAGSRVSGLGAPLCAGAHAISLSALNGPFGQFDTAQARRAYLTAWHAVDRLHSKFGEAKLQELLREMGKGRPFPDAFENTYGLRYEKFATAFDNETP